MGSEMCIRDSPEIVPGPGWPTLAELNLTSAQLYAMPPPDQGKQASTPLPPLLPRKNPPLTVHPLSATRAAARALHGRNHNKGEQGYCGPSDDAYANVDLIIACYHYLSLQGDKKISPTPHRILESVCKVDNQAVVGLTGVWHLDRKPPASAAYVLRPSSSVHHPAAREGGGS